MKFFLAGILGMCVLFRAFSVFAAEPIANWDVKVPETIVYFNSWPGEHESVLFKNIKISPVKQTNVYTFKDINSHILRTVQPGEFVTLITADFHTYPAKSAVIVLKEQSGLVPGNLIYLMSYIAASDSYLVWYNNNVLQVPAEGIEGIKKSAIPSQENTKWAKLLGQLPPPPDVWLSIQTVDGKNGWIKYEPE